jgi:transposase InsO family protein
MFLVLIDSHSKWIETFCTSTASSAAVIEELRTVFAQFGLPDTIVTDNGSCFVSDEFKVFLRKNGVHHITSAPYHPATNGLAERAVQIVKKGLKKVTEGSIRSRLAQILFAYRITPQSTTGVSPSELLLGRRARSRLDLLKPDIVVRVEHKQQQQKLNHDQSAKERAFITGESVFVKNRSSDPAWLPGKVQEVTGPLSYRVKLEDGRLWRCHQDQLRKRPVEREPEIVPLPDLSPSPEPEPEPESTETSRTTIAEGTQRAYPRRAHVQPDRYEPEL